VLTKSILALGFSAAVAVTLTACAGGRFLTIEPRQKTAAPYALTGEEKVAQPRQAIGWTRVKPAQYEPPSRAR
jgi:hypothetical protein